MSNCISQVIVQDHRMTPVEAELIVSASAMRYTPGTELRGRIVGPRCLYSETVEVAYPFRPPGPQKSALASDQAEHLRNIANCMEMQVIIPEPSFWDPISPFLYEVVAELWQDGKRCDQTKTIHGLRTLQLGKHGLRWNGQPLTLRGTEHIPSSEAEAVALREAGYNLLIATHQDRNLWNLADRVGLLVLIRLSEIKGDRFRPVELLEHPCCFGFLLGAENLGDEALLFVKNDRRALIGKELEKVPQTSLPDEVSFIVCRENWLDDLSDLRLPRLVRLQGRIDLKPVTIAKRTTPHILGWVDG